MLVDQDQNRYGIEVDHEGTTWAAVKIASTVTQGAAIDATSIDSLTTGQIANFTSDSDDTSARSLVRIVNDNALATSTTGLFIDQDANYRALTISSATTSENTFIIDTPATTTGNVFYIAEMDSVTSGKAIGVDCGSTGLATTATSGLVYISHDANSGANVNNLLFIINPKVINLLLKL